MLPLTPSPADIAAHAKSMTKMLSEYAGEPVEYNHFGDGFDAFCKSELGAYRIAYKYRYSDPKQWSVKYSPNLQTWIFTFYKSEPAPSK